jgi:hypothetical protein
MAIPEDIQDGDIIVIGFNLFDGLPRAFVGKDTSGQVEWATTILMPADPLPLLECNFRSLFVFSWGLVFRNSNVLVPRFGQSANSTGSNRCWRSSGACRTGGFR